MRTFVCVGVMLIGLLCGGSPAQAQLYEEARQEALATARAYSAQAAELDREARRVEQASAPGVVSREAICLRVQAANLRQAQRRELERVVQLNRAQATFQARSRQWAPRYIGRPSRIRGGINVGGFYIRF